MKLPSPQDLAIAIATTCLERSEKAELLRKLPEMNEQEIIDLYQALLELSAAEKKFVNEVQLIDLKYQVEVDNKIQEKKTDFDKSKLAL